MAAGPVGVTHPAKKWYVLTALLAFLGWLVALIAIFVPWSWKDTAVFERTYVGLWQNCVEQTNSPLNGYACLDNDVDQIGSISGGDEKCRGYIVATQVFTVATVVLSFLLLIVAALLIGKLWSKPLALAAYCAILALLAFGCALVAFLMWIVYAEQNCQPGNPLFPLVGYSWGWILMVISTIFLFFAMLTAYLALFMVLKFKPFIPHQEPPAFPIMEMPYYPTVMEAPVYPAVMEASVYPLEVMPMSTPILEPLSYNVISSGAGMAYPAMAPSLAYPGPAYGGFF